MFRRLRLSQGRWRVRRRHRGAARCTCDEIEDFLEICGIGAIEGADLRFGDLGLNIFRVIEGLVHLRGNIQSRGDLAKVVDVFYLLILHVRYDKRDECVPTYERMITYVLRTTRRARVPRRQRAPGSMTSKRSRWCPAHYPPTRLDTH